MHLFLIKDGRCSASVPEERWEKLEGSFSLSALPDRVVLYFEGPSPGVELLVESVVVSCPSRSDLDVCMMCNIIFYV